jgi:hypothetical protein
MRGDLFPPAALALFRMAVCLGDGGREDAGREDCREDMKDAAAFRNEEVDGL